MIHFPFSNFRHRDSKKTVSVEVAGDDALEKLGKSRETERIDSESFLERTDLEKNVTRHRLNNNNAKEASSKMTFEKLVFAEVGDPNLSQVGKISPKDTPDAGHETNSTVISGPNSNYDENKDGVQLKKSLGSNKIETGTTIGALLSSNPFSGLADTSSSCSSSKSSSSSGSNPFLNNSNPFLSNDNSNNPFYTMPNDLYRTNFDSKNPFLSSSDVGVDVNASETSSKKLENIVGPRFATPTMSPSVSPGSSPRTVRNRLIRESRRISIDKTGHYLHLNQYRLLDSIGEVSDFLIENTDKSPFELNC